MTAIDNKSWVFGPLSDNPYKNPRCPGAHISSERYMCRVEFNHWRYIVREGCVIVDLHFLSFIMSP